MSCTRRQPCPEPSGPNRACRAPTQKGHGLTVLGIYQKKQISFGTISENEQNVRNVAEKPFSGIRRRRGETVLAAGQTWIPCLSCGYRGESASWPGQGTSRHPFILRNKKGLPQTGQSLPLHEGDGPPVRSAHQKQQANRTMKNRHGIARLEPKPRPGCPLPCIPPKPHTRRREHSPQEKGKALQKKRHRRKSTTLPPPYRHRSSPHPANSLSPAQRLNETSFFDQTGRIHATAGLPGLLRRVHGYVALPYQVVQLRSRVRARRDADTRGHHAQVIRNLKRL